MELKLENFIKALELTTNIHQQNEAPIVVRITDDASGTSTVFCCSYYVPRYVMLPVEAVWIDFNPESETYRHAYVRTTKGETPDTDVWKELYFYADAFGDQAYDPDDLSMISVAMPSPATVLTHGIGYLSAGTIESVVVIEGDERLSDARDPLPHGEMHVEKPATIIASDAGIKTIKNQVAPTINSTLVLDGNEYVWRKLKESDIGGLPV